MVRRWISKRLLKLSAGDIGRVMTATRQLGVGLSGGAEAVIIPEVPYSLFDMCNDLKEMYSRGKKSSIIIVAEGALTADLVAKLGPVTDFFGVGEEIWHAENPAAALRALLAPLG